MFQRKILNNLQAWKANPNRKPLVLRGARQVGKTTTIDIFSESFEQYIYLNLELPEDKNLFQKDIVFDDLLESIFFYKNKNRKLKTLIFIDEIQNVPSAVSALRYFYEKANDLYVIAAGSLLESLIDRQINFPVGRVEYLFMYPLIFEEFVSATGETQILEFLYSVPIPEFAHEKILKLFHRFLLIGGMPEIIKTYIENKDINSLNSIYQNLLISYMDDVEKYASSSTQALIIRHCIKNSFFAAGTRIKFQGFGNSNYKSREIGEALRILEKALLIRLVYPSTSTSLPITSDLKKSPKLQILDTGLVNFFSNIQKELFLTDNLENVYKGKIGEHIIAQELIALSKSPLQEINFWVRQKKESNAEVNFLFQHEDLIIPVEVKSGAAGSLRSLQQFINIAPHHFAVRFWSGTIQIDKLQTTNGKKYFLLNLPLYVVSKLSDYIDWFIKNIHNATQ